VSKYAKAMAVMGAFVCVFAIAAGVCFDLGYKATGGSLALLSIATFIMSGIVPTTIGE